MSLLLLGAVAGGASGALGYITAEKIHSKDLVEQYYPLYSLVFFSILIVCAKLIMP